MNPVLQDAGGRSPIALFMKRRAGPTSPLTTRPPLARMHALHRALQAGRHPSCPSMARELEVSGKTIQRDLDYMRDQMGLPIAFSRKDGGFVYTAPVSSLPPR